MLAPGPAVFSGTTKFKGDGADGIGFRIRGTTGTILGPYLPDGHFRYGDIYDLANNNRSYPGQIVPPKGGIYDDSTAFLGDRDGNAILYFPRKRKAVIVNVDTYFGSLASSPAYVANDNDPGQAVRGPNHPFAGIGHDASGNLWALQQFQFQLPGVIRDAQGIPTLPDPNQATKLPYLLWDAGPDGQFCTEDDVTNFKN